MASRKLFPIYMKSALEHTAVKVLIYGKWAFTVSNITEDTISSDFPLCWELQAAKKADIVCILPRENWSFSLINDTPALKCCLSDIRGLYWPLVWGCGTVLIRSVRWVSFTLTNLIRRIEQWRSTLMRRSVIRSWAQETSAKSDSWWFIRRSSSSVCSTTAGSTPDQHQPHEGLHKLYVK